MHYFQKLFFKLENKDWSKAFDLRKDETKQIFTAM